MTHRVPEQPALPRPVAARDFRAVTQFMVDLVRTVQTALSEHAFSINLSLPRDGGEAMTRPLPLATFTVATLPTAADWTGGMIFVSDGGAGTKFRGSDGTSWLSLG